MKPLTRFIAATAVIGSATLLAGVGTPAAVRGAGARTSPVPGAEPHTRPLPFERTDARSDPAAGEPARILTPGDVHTRSLRADTSLAERLRAGGYVLACRHAITGPDPDYDGPVSFTDRSTQRLLSAEGEAQARRIGEELQRLRIPIGEVYASPYFRTFDSAELTFGRAEASRALGFGKEEEDQRALRELFTTPPAAGVNRALVTHQGVLYPILPSFKRGEIDEGDCIVVKPLGSAGFEVVRRVPAGDWARMR